MNERIVKIIAEDGRFFESGFPQGTPNKEIVKDLLGKCCIPLKEIYDENYNLIWRKRYTVKLSNGKYELADMTNAFKYMELAIQKLGKMEDEEESELGLWAKV